MSKPRILFIGKLPPPSTGEGNVILCYFQILPSLGYDLKLLDVGDRDPKIKANSLNIYNVIRFFKNVFQLISIIIKWNPKIVNVNVASNFALFKSCILLFVSKLFRIKTVAHLHAGWMLNEYRGYSYLRFILVKMFMQIPDIWVLPSENLLNVMDYFKIENNRRVILRNPIKKEIFDNSAYKSEWNTNFIFIGSIIYRKGIDLIAEAFSLVQRDGYNFNLTILGFQSEPTNEERELKALLQSKISGNSLILREAAEGNEYIELLKNNTFLILPSRAENLPIAMLESMCFGLIPIVSNVGVISAVIKNEANGFIITPDVNSIYLKIKSIIDGKYNLSQLSKNSRDYVLQYHSPYTIGESLDQHYKTILKSNIS